jgi:hypothetical protein
MDWAQRASRKMRARGPRKEESLGIKSSFENACFVLVLFYGREGFTRRPILPWSPTIEAP